MLGGCGDDDEETASADAAGGECAEVAAPAAKDRSSRSRPRCSSQVSPRPRPCRRAAETSSIELDTERSPTTANSFAFLARQGFYDDTVFHRIAPGFVIQGGDPLGSDPGLAGTGDPGYAVREPPPQRTSYTTGLVAMAKTAVEPPGTSGSQFFVVTAPADAGLPADYAVLGEVTEGLEVTERIGELGDPATEQPTQTVLIDSIAIDAG